MKEFRFGAGASACTCLAIGLLVKMGDWIAEGAMTVPGFGFGMFVYTLLIFIAFMMFALAME